MSATGAGALTGTRAGPWLLLAPIAEGGMGAVYRARRDDGSYEQYAAIKLIRPELLGSGDELRAEMMRRFDEERHILAQLDHPGIARIVDGGTTGSGVPWLAMELIEGKPITHFLREKGLGVDGRVRLFIGVCEAVQAAHRGLVVHRDIKPANLLVDENGRVKLVDFGIAKALDARRAGDAAVQTRTGWAAMTPDYASPEQLQGGVITTATDVYALGVVLYELLTGERPYDLSGATPAQIERIVCDTDARPPSHVGGGTADVVVPWRKRLRGDLDHIVMKAMRKEPEARYASAADMAADLRRHLEGLPVSARGDAFGYRARKFVRRNALTMAAAFALFAVLLTATLVALDQARDAREQAARAELEATRAAQVTGFLQGLLLEADPYEGQREATIADALRAAAARITTEFPDQPAIEAAVRRAIGRAFMGRGLADDAEPHLRRAQALKREVYGDLDPRTLSSGGDLAWLAFERGDSEGALQRYRPLVDAFPRNVDVLREHTLANDYAAVLNASSRYAEAEPIMRRIVEALDGGADSIEASLAYGNLAYALHGLERLDEAGDYYRRALDAHDPRDLANLSILSNNYAALLNDRGDAKAAFGQIARAVDLRREALGSDHPGMVLPLLNLAENAGQLGDRDSARAAAQEAMDIARARLPEDNVYALYSRMVLGQMVLDETGEEDLLEALLDDLERLTARRVPMEAAVLRWLAGSAQARKDIPRARGLASEALRRSEAFLGVEHAETEASRTLVAELEGDPQG